MSELQRQHQRSVIDKISEVLDATGGGQADHLAAALDAADRVFIAGAGRSKLVGGFLAMRLMHCGYDSRVVGEITIPAIGVGDLMVTVSGSGETEQLIAFTKRAKLSGAGVALITAQAGSTIGGIADQVFQIGAPGSFTEVEGMPMGTVFELSALCFLEALISQIICGNNILEREMKSRHANLE